jgi:UDP-3-O-acyl-N-acetylglucosamine deacetylase
MPSTPEFQQTVGKIAGFTGTALHTGEKVTLRLHPALVDHGIKFRRKDLQDEPTIDAKIENLKTVERATTIGEGSVRVHTVEHVLAALSAMGVDNAIVEMDANEPPIGDGSAQPYVDLIKKAGVVAQEEPRKFFDVREADARGSENRCAARFTAGRQISHFVHTGRTKQSIHAVFVIGTYAVDFRVRDRSGTHICLLRGC